MHKSRLLSPGPAPIPDFVKEAITQPVIHHRTSEFETFYGDLLEDFKYLFQTEQYVCSMIGSGTYGVEAAIYSLFREGEEVLVLNIGKFGERWIDYGQLCGLNVYELKKEWGHTIAIPETIEALDKIKVPKGIIITHSETSTGVCLDLEEIAFAIRQQYPELLILVDAITSVGALPFYMDDWKIDCAVVAAQKALMNPAGTAAFALSEMAKNKLQATHPADFRNLHNYLHWAEQKNYPYTPPVSLLYGLKAATAHIRTKTLPTVWNEVHQASQFFKEEIQKLGGKLLAQQPSDSLTAFYIDEVDMTFLLKQLEEIYRLKLSGGQSMLKGKIARISHMGLADQQAAAVCITAISEILNKNP